MLDTLSPQRRRVVLLAVLAVLVATILGAGALLLRERVSPVAQDDLGPVLLVSGYGGATRALEPMRQALRELGRDAVVVPPVGQGTGDIEVQARALDREADAAMARFGAESVDVVGYSAGGLVARSWVRSHGGGSKARRVMTVGSPHHGTDLAARAESIVGFCPLACRQLQPDSALLRELNARDETPAGPRWVSVWSQTDQVVVPAESSRLDGALNLAVQDVCAGARVSHGQLPASPVVIEMLETALGGGEPARPDDVDC